jgi:hypothetical protein
MSAPALLGILLFLTVGQAGESTEEAYLGAVRRGDAAAVRSFLDKGMPVDTPFRYGRTALSFVADRGHVEVARLLLERGADANAKDTFYGATPLVWALEKGHVEIVRLLLAKGAEGGEQALAEGAAKGNVELVKAGLELAKPTAVELSAALEQAARNDHKEVAELLRKAGAVPPPPADHVVAPETLARYAGMYRSSRDPRSEITLAAKDGSLGCSSCGPDLARIPALDDVTFRHPEDAAFTIVFTLEGERVTGFTLRQGRRETRFERVEPSK